MSLIDIRDVDTVKTTALLDLAADLREAGNCNIASGRIVVPMFFEPSTRTRLSFDIAASRLGASVVALDPSTSSTSKGETLRDTARTVGAMGPDLLVLRHQNVGAPEAVSRWAGIPVINAGDGRRAHPTQTLADLLTIRDHFGGFDGLRIGVVGDIANSRVARGLLGSLPDLGAEVIAVAPSTFVARRDDWEIAHTSEFESVIGELDIIYLLRVQKERGGALGYPTDAEFHRRFGLSDARVELMKPGCVLMHPGPMNRGVEVSDTLADSDRSLILAQVSAGIPVRMAVIKAILDGWL